MLAFAFDAVLFTFSVTMPSFAPLLALPLTMTHSRVPPLCWWCDGAGTAVPSPEGLGLIRYANQRARAAPMSAPAPDAVLYTNSATTPPPAP